MNLSLRKRRGRAAGGYSFAEVLVGSTLTLFMSISFFALIDTSTDMMRTARENVRATQIMVNRLEGLRLYAWSQVSDPTLFPTNFTEYYYPAGTNDGTAGVLYTGSVQVASAPMSPAPSYATNMEQVTVTLTWSSGNVLRTRQMSTFVARYGEQNYVIQN
ncbi:MAG: hypothetical protein KGR98_09530 [Verrucomicrobia bacterium]|nr:hypothetical protein [Verrucomicrobiota bacterium]